MASAQSLDSNRIEKERGITNPREELRIR